MSSRRIMYLRDQQNNPIGCIAINFEKGAKFVEFQLSVLNSSEDHFDRSMARHIALGRMVEAPYVAFLSSMFEPSMHQISKAVMLSISKTTMFPTAARKASKRWLKLNGARF